MARKRSAHLCRVMVEGISSFSPYKGGKLNYVRDYDPNPITNVDLISKIDIERAIKILHEPKCDKPCDHPHGQISDQELLMLRYVALDGRLSRRDISKMIEKDMGYYVDQRTISRRLESAYLKIAKFLGWEFSDNRIFKMVARQKGYPNPYILNDDEIDQIQQIMEKV